MKFTKAYILLVILALLTACSSKNEQASTVDKTELLPTVEITHEFPDTLVVGTIYSPASFFTLRGDTLGYDYERIRAFARENKMAI